MPSLTETLLDCGVDVIGRTRFCIHPKTTVGEIVAVGGTKQVNWQSIEALSPDLVIMDKEENTLEMAEACPYPLHATHVTSVDCVGDELAALAGVLGCEALTGHSENWRVLADRDALDFRGWDVVPGVIDKIGQKSTGFSRVEYMIWQDPWMAVSPDTFIGSVLTKVGLGRFLTAHETPYPTLGDEIQPDPDVFYLFSSEPFPFGRHVDALTAAGFNGVLVDGEFYSWFGTRSYRLLNHFMESQV